MLKWCSCGVPGCEKLGPAGEHDWDPLALPVDDCIVCSGTLAVPAPGDREDALPVRWGNGYAHPACAGE